MKKLLLVIVLTASFLYLPTLPISCCSRKQRRYRHLPTKCFKRLINNSIHFLHTCIALQYLIKAVMERGVSGEYLVLVQA